MELSEKTFSPAGLADIEHAAVYLGCSVATLRWLRRTRQLKALKMGARLYFRRCDLDEFVQRQIIDEQ